MFISSTIKSSALFTFLPISDLPHQIYLFEDSFSRRNSLKTIKDTNPEIISSGIVKPSCLLFLFNMKLKFIIKNIFHNLTEDTNYKLR